MKKAFTLIELLIVIAIIGVLSSVTLTSLSHARERARLAKLKADFKQIETQIELTRTAQDKTLLEITGSGCSVCEGDAVTNLSWQRIGFSNPPVDPWGSIYQLDENEKEFNPTDCRRDSIFSKGPDRTQGGGDDIYYNISPWVCPP